MNLRIRQFFKRSSPTPVALAKHEIYISSNCQTGGLLAALQCFLPTRDIAVLRFPKSNDIVTTQQFQNALRGAKIWVTTGRFELCDDSTVTVIKIPDITFAAFHPDVKMAVNLKTNFLTTRHNNSQIVVWAYNHNLSASNTLKLFNCRVFRALGYFDCWPKCVADMSARFTNAEIASEEFEKFFLRVKRLGQFMHTPNHPRIEAMIELARIVAKRVGEKHGRVDGHIVIPDALTYSQWPVYPEIGDELGLPGSYQWRFTSADKIYEIDGLPDYIDFAHQNYADQKIKPTEIACMQQDPAIDAILREEAQAL